MQDDNNDDIPDHLDNDNHLEKPETERDHYRRTSQESTRNAQILSHLRRTPVGQRAYMWEMLNPPFVGVQCEYVGLRGRPQERPFLKMAPELLRIMVGPINDGKGLNVTQEQALAGVKVLAEKELSFASREGFPLPY